MAQHFPIDPRSASANLIGGINTPQLQEQMLAQGGLPFQMLTRMEFAASQAGNTERMQKIRALMGRRRSALESQLLVPQPTQPVEQSGAQGLINAANQNNPFELFQREQFDQPLREGEQGDFRVFR